MRIGRNNKNSGFSLVELIIVIAIMAIVVTVAGLSVGTLTGRRVRKCADEIVSTIERARVLTLGKEQNNVECVISYDSTDKEYHAMVYQVITEPRRKCLTVWWAEIPLRFRCISMMITHMLTL